MACLGSARRRGSPELPAAAQKASPWAGLGRAQRRRRILLCLTEQPDVARPHWVRDVAKRSALAGLYAAAFESLPVIIPSAESKQKKEGESEEGRNGERESRGSKSSAAQDAGGEVPRRLRRARAEGGRAREGRWEEQSIGGRGR